MILRLDGEASRLGVEARPLGDGPALQHSVQLEAEVIVKTPRPVLLDHERERPTRRCCRRRARGLRRAVELAPPAILLEPPHRGERLQGPDLPRLSSLARARRNPDRLSGSP